MYARQDDSRFVGLPKLRVISLGAGVQSTVMALKAAKGKFRDEQGNPVKIDYAIFADTGWEPKSVYHHLDWLEKELLDLKFGFPIKKASVKDLYRQRGKSNKKWRLQDHLLAGKNSTGQDFFTIPAFILNEDKKKSLARRQCTREYKLDPIRFMIRQLAGVKPRQVFPKREWVEQWIGISTDEIIRMKDSRDVWCKNRWPLIEQKTSRKGCLAWFRRNYPGQHLPRSACIGCPLRTDAEWAEMKNSDREAWEQAIHIDQALRKKARAKKFGGVVYLHRKMIPLDKVSFSKRKTSRQRNRFLEECEGMCGV